ALSLNNLGELYHAQGRYSDAEPLYKRSLATREKALGPDHPDVAVSLNNLAELYRTQGRYSDAEPLWKRALAIYEKALGPDHPDVGLSLSNLAALYTHQGRYADAEPLLKRGLAIREKRSVPIIPMLECRSTIWLFCMVPKVATRMLYRLYKRLSRKTVPTNL